MGTQNENHNEDARIEAAHQKVLIQEAQVASIALDDPRRLEEQRVLNAMRQNAATAITNRAMTRDEADAAE